MQVKLFHLRLSKEHYQTDQDEMNKFLDSVSVKRMSSSFVAGTVNFWSILIFYETENRTIVTKSSKNQYSVDTILNDEEQKILTSLKEWRNDKSTELGVPQYMVCTNSSLIGVAKEKPHTLEELIQINGFGDQKTAKFGNDIIALINSLGV